MARHVKIATRIWSYKNIVSMIAFFGAFLIIGLLVYDYSKIDTGLSSEVCIKYETITNGGQNTPIGKRQCTLSLERVNTEVTRERGLSGRSSMPASRGMLFVFDSIGRQCIWMKDMHFNIDIIWLNIQGTVLKLAENVTPSSYPDSYCADDTYFVIEVNAGVAKSAGLSLGSRVNL